MNFYLLDTNILLRIADTSSSQHPLVLAAITNILRKYGVVGKFVEFYGPALKHLSLFERATIANMAPEYGATCGYFPIEAEVIKYLDLTGRSKSQLALVEAYAKEQGVWCEHTDDDKMKLFMKVSGVDGI